MLDDYKDDDSYAINVRFIDSCCIRLTFFSIISTMINAIVITLVLVTPNIKTLLVIKLIVFLTMPFIYITIWMILSIRHKISRYGKYLRIKRFMQNLELLVDSIDTTKGKVEPVIEKSCMGLSNVHIRYAFNDGNKNSHTGSLHRISLTSPTNAKNIQGKVNHILDKCNKLSSVV